MGRDWFVATGIDTQGLGTRARPFHDPWLAFLHAAPGDSIHLAAGTYFGRFDRTSWVVDCPNLSVLGGYSTDFSSRTPWATPSVLAYYPGYEAVRENNMLAGADSHAGLVLDGLFFDAADRNAYSALPSQGIEWYPPMAGPIAAFEDDHVTIRNCVFLNSANGGISLSGSGSTFENNFVLNMMGPPMLDLRPSNRVVEKAITVTRNTFCFAHDPNNPPGRGGDTACAIRVNVPAIIDSNAFIGCGNSAITVVLASANVRIERNTFFLSPHSLIESRASDSQGAIHESTLAEIQDFGFDSCVDNAVHDPSMSGLNSSWVDMYTRQLLACNLSHPYASANLLRANAALAPLEPSDLQQPEHKGVLFPRLAVKDVLQLSLAAPGGFHAIELPVSSIQSEIERRRPSTATCSGQILKR